MLSEREALPGTVSTAAKMLTGAVFSVLAISFVGTTAALVTEFHDTHWLMIATFHSHLFLFFPSFGLVALAAFLVPTSVFTDLYLRHVPYGRLRIALGFPLLVLLSIRIASEFTSGGVPAVWWLAPQTLQEDAGDPKGCASRAAEGPAALGPAALGPAAGGTAATLRPACRRVPALDAVEAVREVSQRRVGLSPFVRDCQADPLLEPPVDQQAKRYCFVSKSLATAPECCERQTHFNAALEKMYDTEPEHSLTGRVHAVVLPFEVFFILFVLILGVLLALWRRTLDRLYAPFTQRIERGMLVGAVAMLLWPLSNHAFLQSASVLYGKGEGSYGMLSPLLSGAFGIWALALLLFFFRRGERDLESAAKIGGALASAIAVLKYNQLIDYAVRFLGSGAKPMELLGLGVLSLMAFGWLARSVFMREHTGVGVIADVPDSVGYAAKDFTAVDAVQNAGFSPQS